MLYFRLEHIRSKLLSFISKHDTNCSQFWQEVEWSGEQTLKKAQSERAPPCGSFRLVRIFWTRNEKTMLEYFEEIHLRCGNQTIYLIFFRIDYNYEKFCEQFESLNLTMLTWFVSFLTMRKLAGRKISSCGTCFTFLCLECSAEPSRLEQLCSRNCQLRCCNRFSLLWTKGEEGV